jgi:hypothetical protein
MTASEVLAGLGTMPAMNKKQADAWLRDSRLAFSETVRDPWE